MKENVIVDRYGDSTGLTGELTNGKIITQPFEAVGNKLKTVGIEFGTYCRINTCSVRIDIIKDGKLIKTCSTPANKILDNRIFDFQIDATLEVGEIYILKLFGVNASFGNTVTAKCGAPLHANLFMQKNGMIMKAELFCEFVYEDDGTILEAIKDRLRKKQIESDNVKMQPNLSIVIPTAKRLDHLKNCLDSLYNNTDDFEIIVVSNNPEPEFGIQTQKLVSLYPNCLHIGLPFYGGYVFTCNAGAKISRGKHICIMNDDIIAGRNWSTRMLEAMQEDENVAQVGPSMAYLDDDFVFTPKATRKPYLEGWCFIIPRRIYEKFGLFDEKLDFAYCEDSDFSTGLIHNGYKIRKIHSNIVHLGSQTSKSCFDMKRFTDGCEDNNKEYLRKKWSKK